MNRLDLSSQISRRRTFAIISHPDAGKTTLTEGLLLYSGAITRSGSVRAGRGQAHATSDWMEIERKRGISITSSALQFEYDGHCINLLDTPGHQDFSEDTYRTLVAADSALMLIDGAKGIEPQTIKLFEVCRDRGIPIVTVVNKMDRPTRDSFDLLDEVEKVLGLTAVPLTWPIGSGSSFRGVCELDNGTAHLFEREGLRRCREQVLDLGDAALAPLLGQKACASVRDETETVRTCIESFSARRFLAGEITPVFFASALSGFGVENILQRFIQLAPPPGPLTTLDGEVPPDAEFFSGFVYKIAANMDRRHRDRIAFLRVASGRFERGMSAKHIRLGRELKLSHPHRFFGGERVTIDEAYPGDVIGLINPGLFRIGDVLSSGPRIELRRFPRFSPEIFAQVRPREPSMGKGFNRGLTQLGEEGVVQIFWPREGRREPILGVVGELQLDVFEHRLANEYHVQIQQDRLGFRRARWLHHVTPELLEVLPRVVKDQADRPVALFHSDFEIRHATERYQGLELLPSPPGEEQL